MSSVDMRHSTTRNPQTPSSTHPNFEGQFKVFYKIMLVTLEIEHTTLVAFYFIEYSLPPPQTQSPGSYHPSSSNQALSMANNPPAWVGELYGSL